MDQRSDQILEHIEAQRDRLGQNLNELENRVKETTDWRAQFDKHPMMMMGVAMGGGLLLGAIVGGTGSVRSSGRYSSSRAHSWSSDTGYSSSSSASPVSSRSTSPVVREHKQRALDTLDNIKAALISYGASRAKQYLSQMLPGFEPHLREAEQRHGYSGEGSYRRGTEGPYRDERSYRNENLESERAGGSAYQSGSNVYPGSSGPYESGGAFNGPYEGGTGYRSGENLPPRTPGY